MRHARKKKRNLVVRHAMIVSLASVVFILVGFAAFFTVKTVQEWGIKSVSVPSYEGNISAVTSQMEQGTANSQVPASSVEPQSSSSVTSAEPVSSTLPVDPSAPAYQSKYPEIVAPQVEKIAAKDGDKVIYLTFDDGPSSMTLPILDVLDEYGIKATFFVVGTADDSGKKLMKEIVDRGHAIAIHTYSHDYHKIYASVDAFLDDFAKEYNLIYEATGVKPTIFRFAGGSVNDYNSKIAKELVAEMSRRGFTYYDWNVSSGDAEHGATKTSIYNDTVNGAKARGKSIILCHDTNAKGNTLSQLPSIISELKKIGYRFEVLDPSVKPIIFPLPK